MASAFSHFVVPLAMKLAIKQKVSISYKLLLLGLFFSAAPDLDVIAFKFGIPYESPFGHRGFTHSLAFAALCSSLFVGFRRQLGAPPLAIFVFLFISMASHAVLDAVTSGGEGVAFLWPFSDERFFFPWREVLVSPIGIKSFFTERGARVITSEIKYLWAPIFAAAILVRIGIGIFIKARAKGEP